MKKKKIIISKNNNWDDVAKAERSPWNANPLPPRPPTQQPQLFLVKQLQGARSDCTRVKRYGTRPKNPQKEGMWVLEITGTKCAKQII